MGGVVDFDGQQVAAGWIAEREVADVNAYGVSSWVTAASGAVGALVTMFVSTSIATSTVCGRVRAPPLAVPPSSFTRKVNQASADPENGAAWPSLAATAAAGMIYRG